MANCSFGFLRIYRIFSHFLEGFVRKKREGIREITINYIKKCISISFQKHRNFLELYD
jgi:hypothetical protein